MEMAQLADVFIFNGSLSGQLEITAHAWTRYSRDKKTKQREETEHKLENTPEPSSSCMSTHTLALQERTLEDTAAEK